eukprot:TRINITY_DN9843_c0_g1_i1.p1 TRINITY_DN9843_c0_g1~~TRINITY_DN9843_c0_g1_i1.p1  ORF type:complete len:687 (-),score=70.50 TRINITY_DN9843_c0_g1_i1:76-2136(-)
MTMSSCLVKGVGRIYRICCLWSHNFHEYMEVQRFLRPEETTNGRLPFQGLAELIPSEFSELAIEPSNIQRKVYVEPLPQFEERTQFPDNVFFFRQPGSATDSVDSELINLTSQSQRWLRMRQLASESKHVGGSTDKGSAAHDSLNNDSLSIMHHEPVLLDSEVILIELDIEPEANTGAVPLLCGSNSEDFVASGMESVEEQFSVFNTDKQSVQEASIPKRQCMESSNTTKAKCQRTQDEVVDNTSGAEEQPHGARSNGTSGNAQAQTKTQTSDTSSDEDTTSSSFEEAMEDHCTQACRSPPDHQEVASRHESDGSDSGSSEEFELPKDLSVFDFVAEDTPPAPEDRAKRKLHLPSKSCTTSAAALRRSPRASTAKRQRVERIHDILNPPIKAPTFPSQKVNGGENGVRADQPIIVSEDITPTRDVIRSQPKRSPVKPISPRSVMPHSPHLSLSKYRQTTLHTTPSAHVRIKPIASPACVLPRQRLLSLDRTPMAADHSTNGQTKIRVKQSINQGCAVRLSHSKSKSETLVVDSDEEDRSHPSVKLGSKPVAKSINRTARKRTTARDAAVVSVDVKDGATATRKRKRRIMPALEVVTTTAEPVHEAGPSRNKRSRKSPTYDSSTVLQHHKALASDSEPDPDASPCDSDLDDFIVEEEEDDEQYSTFGMSDATQKEIVALREGFFIHF